MLLNCGGCLLFGMLFLPLAVVSSAVARVFQSCKLVRATGCSERCLVIAHSLVCSLLFSLKLTWKPRSLSMLLFCLDLGGWRSQEVLLDIYVFDYLLKKKPPAGAPRHFPAAAAAAAACNALFAAVFALLCGASGQLTGRWYTFCPQTEQSCFSSKLMFFCSFPANVRL